MTDDASDRRFRLRLQASDVLPAGLSWSILEGYVRTTSFDQDGEAFTLAVWGPGEWVSSNYSTLVPVEMQCISAVSVEKMEPSEAEVLAFMRLQIRNTEQIFEINRLRSADLRLLAMLRWISVRFGQVNSHGHRLSLKEMNLTHRDLADLCGLTRVTVTKNLNRFKTLGLLRGVGDTDLLIPADARLPRGDEA
ncbi:MAG: Crp/Fnr family transcriptional regulator [Cyanobacteriota bacterium]|nr:Crp/Fnr family transcriptional regulator [Cyanobacteriota bacterium]